MVAQARATFCIVYMTEELNCCCCCYCGCRCACCDTRCRSNCPCACVGVGVGACARYYYPACNKGQVAHMHMHMYVYEVHTQILMERRRPKANQPTHQPPTHARATYTGNANRCRRRWKFRIETTCWSFSQHLRAFLSKRCNTQRGTHKIWKLPTEWERARERERIKWFTKKSKVLMNGSVSCGRFSRADGGNTICYQRRVNLRQVHAALISQSRGSIKLIANVNVKR